MSGNLFRRTVIAGFLCLGLFVAQSLLLQEMAEWLTVERPNAAADEVALVGGDLRFDWAADRYEEKPSLRILLFECPPDRLVDLKIGKPTCELDREALHNRGVPDESIRVLTYSQRNEWEWARRLDE